MTKTSNEPYLVERKGFSVGELTNTKPSQVSTRSWRSVVTSSARNDFTLRHLLKRQFGTSEEAVRELIIGDHSFGGVLTQALQQQQDVCDIQCIPSEAKPCPGKLGYYTGGHTTREHSKGRRVDTLQVELPLCVRTQESARREAATKALASAMAAFQRLHYSAHPLHKPCQGSSR